MDLFAIETFLQVSLLNQVRIQVYQVRVSVLVGIDDPYKVVGFVSLATCDTN